MFDYLCDLLSRMSDFYSTHCLLGLLGGICGCEARLCLIIYVTYFHGLVISILLTAYLACWAAYAAVRLFDYLCDLLSRRSDFYSTHCLLGLLGGCEVVFDYLSDLLSRMSDFYSTHCLLGLLGGVCSCWVRLCLIIYVTYFHG